MTDYISREAVIEMINKIVSPIGPHADAISRTVAVCETEAIPAADVREVVLCKNCKYFYKDEDGYTMCDNSEGYDHVTEDDFCSRGADMREDIDGR